MSTTLFAAFAVLAPVYGLWRKFTSSRPVGPIRPGSVARGGMVVRPPLPAPALELARVAKKRNTSAAATRARPPLRVVRVMEAGQAAMGGRMLISGRMADVCAELDRMVAREAALHTGA